MRHLHIMTQTNHGSDEVAGYRIATSTADYMELIRKYSHEAIYNTLSYNIIRVEDETYDIIKSLQSELKELWSSYKDKDTLDIVRAAIGTFIEAKSEALRTILANEIKLNKEVN